MVHAGNQSGLLEDRLLHRFNVMDHFMVTHIWQDDVDGFSRFSVRLQKLHLSKKSWWAEKSSPEPPALSERDFEMLPKVKTCTGEDGLGRPCGKTFYQVYKSGWMCLNADCKRFWKVNGLNADPVEDQQFDEKFLSFRTNFDVDECLNRLQHPLVPTVNLDNENSHTRRDGMICPKCKRCVPRTYLGYWKCQLEWFATSRVDPTREGELDCDWQYDLKQKVTSLSPSQQQEVSEAYHQARRICPPSFDGYVRVREHLLSYQENMGTVTHFISNQATNTKPNGPDDLFKLLQINSSGLGFRRQRGSRPAGM